MLPQENSLPGTKQKAPGTYRYGKPGSGQYAACMRRHVVRPFKIMSVCRVAIGREALYGRNWGCLADFPFLHFECCYYQAIEYAIARGLARVEAGAQGPHKIQRGYLPVPTYSAHWIADPALAQAIADFLRRETRSIERERAHLAEQSPYRGDDDHRP